MKNYLNYPLKEMRITQNYNSEVSHKKDWYQSTDYRNYPIDDGGKDTGRSYLYCPCNEMKVSAIIEGGIYLTSTSPVTTPTGTFIVTLMAFHINNSDLKKLKVGQIFKRGDIIVIEGKEYAAAYHFHLVFMKGLSTTLVKNSNGSFVCKGEELKPEEAVFLNDFTTVLYDGGIKWIKEPINIGSPVLENTFVDQIKVKITNLNGRNAPNGDKIGVGYVNPGFYNILDTKEEKDYLWYKIEDNLWIAYNSSWEDILMKSSYTKEEIWEITEENQKLQEKINELEKMPKYKVLLNLWGLYICNKL